MMFFWHLPAKPNAKATERRFKMKQFLSFVQKEFYHIFRDKRTMLILLVMPVVLIILFGFAITNEVKDTRVEILDFSEDEITGQIEEHISANRYFTITARLNDYTTADDMFLKNKTDMVIVFGRNFAEEMKRSGSAKIQILVDGTEPNQASVRMGYIRQVLMSYLHGYSESAGVQPHVQIVPITRMLYNPQGKSEYNFVPGVIGLILILICAMMTSISIVREKELGTIEVLLASPLPPICIVLAKLIPYFVISCVNLTTILLLSTGMLHIPIAGSLAGFTGISLLYIFVALSLGLLISNAVNSQLAAMLLSLLLIVPTVYLSGIIFPIESMPAALQNVSIIIPARWYVEAARKLMIQGVELRYVAKETIILSIMAVALFGISWKLFKTRLE